MGQAFNISKRNASALLVTFLSVALAACATVTSATPAGVRTATRPASRPSPGTGSQQGQAKADAAAILASFAAPPGAVRLSRAPGGVGGVLDHAEGYPGVLHLIDDAAWWRVPGVPLVVLGYEKAHLPGWFKLEGQSWGAITPADQPHGPTASGMPANTYHRAGYEFAIQGGLPPLEKAQMLVDAAVGTSGQTYVRVDAQLAWTPARSPAERVPAAVKVITITAQPDMNAPHDIPAPVTVTDPAKVSRVVSLFDGLNIDSSGTHGCLAMSGRGITLAFLARVGGPALASATEELPGCGYVDFTIGGRQQPTLSDWGSFAQEALAIAGVKWAGWNAPKQGLRAATSQRAGNV